MKTMIEHLRNWVGFLFDAPFVLAVLAAVGVTCFFAFVLGAEYELVVGLLALGVMTAFMETRFRAKNGK